MLLEIECVPDSWKQKVIYDLLIPAQGDLHVGKMLTLCGHKEARATKVDIYK